MIVIGQKVGPQYFLMNAGNIRERILEKDSWLSTYWATVIGDPPVDLK